MIHQRLTQSAAFFVIIRTIATWDDKSKWKENIETRLLGRNGNAIALARNRGSRLTKSVSYVSRYETLWVNNLRRKRETSVLNFSSRW